MANLKLGMIGLDTSHVTAFADLLNNSSHPHHVTGGTVVVAYPGEPSMDFALSHGRVEGYTNKLRDEYGVQIVDSSEAVAEASDAILLESVDGRVHLREFEKIAPYGKPVFIDKPFTVDAAEAMKIFDLAEKYNVPLMSCSSLRYAEALVNALADNDQGAVVGADMYGPAAIEPPMPGLFWYGIHSVEMLYRAMGQGCKEVKVTKTDDVDLIVGLWEDGRVGTVRGTRKGKSGFGGVVHREGGSFFVDTVSQGKPSYASMLEAVMELFQTGKGEIDPAETVEIIRFIDAANISRETGQAVKLS